MVLLLSRLVIDHVLSPPVALLSNPISSYRPGPGLAAAPRRAFQGRRPQIGNHISPLIVTPTGMARRHFLHSHMWQRIRTS